MTLEQAKQKLISEINPKKIDSCKDYGQQYLFTAFITDDSSNEIDPFYLVNKITGKVMPYTIAEDPDKYYSARELLR